MTIQTKTIGRLPVYLGDYDNTRSYGKKNRVTLYGSEFESKHDNNNTAPATWDGAETITFNTTDWQVISNGTDAWIAGNDKPASSEEFPYNGMGRVVLKKHMVNGVNVLTEDAFYTDGSISGQPLENTIFVIKYDFVLGENITIPANCVLEFDGGSISGAHTITGQRTDIQASLVKIFGTDVIIDGTWNIKEAYPEWFGSNGLVSEDATDFITKAFALCNRVCLIKNYYLPNGFTLSGENILYGLKYATVKLGSPIIITASYTNIYDIAFVGNTSVNAIEFGQSASSPDIYRCYVKNCTFQVFNNVFKFNTYCGNIFIEKVVVNNASKVINLTDSASMRYNICVNDSMFDNIDYFGGAIWSVLFVTNCYIGVKPVSQFISQNFNGQGFFRGCTFEITKSEQADSAASIFYDDGKIQFDDCSFIATQATNYYWFGTLVNECFELNNCRFSNYDGNVSGIFRTDTIIEKYGHYKLKNIMINGDLVKSIRDIPIPAANRRFFDLVGYSGICIYGSYDISGMSEGVIYKVYESNPNGDYLRSVMKNNNDILVLMERPT